MGGLRLTKPPTRRQIAAKTLETIHAVNVTADGLHDLHGRFTEVLDRLVALEAWQYTEQTLTRWQRLRRVVGW